MDRQAALDDVVRRFNLVVVYLLGSRADDGLAVLAGEPRSGAGSDLDVGIVWSGQTDWRSLAGLQVALEDVFSPLCVDLVPLPRVDALFQYRAIEGYRVAAPDPTAVDLWELTVMRRAAELLPIQRQIELDRFGMSTT